MSIAYSILLNGKPVEVVFGTREKVEGYLTENMEKYWREYAQFVYINREIYSAHCKWSIESINLKVIP